MDTITDILSNVFVDRKHKRKNVSTTYNENNTYDTTMEQSKVIKESKEIQTEPILLSPKKEYSNQKLASEMNDKLEKNYEKESENSSDKVSEYSDDSNLSIEYKQLDTYNLDKFSIKNRNIIVVCENQEQMIKIMETIFMKLDNEKAIAILERVDRDNFKKIILKNPDMKLSLLKLVKFLPKAIKENSGERIIVDYDFITDDFLKLLTTDSVFYLVVCNRLTKGINIVKNLLNQPIVFVYNDGTLNTYNKVIGMFDKISMNNYVNQECEFFVLDGDVLYGYNG